MEKCCKTTYCVLICSQVQDVPGNFLIQYHGGDDMDEYLKVSAVFHLSGSGDYSRGASAVRQVSSKNTKVDFGNIFRTACDELKQNSGTHTKTGVITLS